MELGLVQQYRLRSHCQYSGQCHPPFFPAGKPDDIALRQLAHSHALQCRRHPGLQFRFRQFLVGRTKCNIFAHRLGKQLILGVLKQHSHPFPNPAHRAPGQCRASTRMVPISRNQAQYAPAAWIFPHHWPQHRTPPARSESNRQVFHPDAGIPPERSTVT